MKRPSPKTASLTHFRHRLTNEPFCGDVLLDDEANSRYISDVTCAECLIRIENIGGILADAAAQRSKEVEKSLIKKGNGR